MSAAASAVELGALLTRLRNMGQASKSVLFVPGSVTSAKEQCRQYPRSEQLAYMDALMDAVIIGGKSSTSARQVARVVHNHEVDVYQFKLARHPALQGEFFAEYEVLNGTRISFVKIVARQIRECAACGAGGARKTCAGCRSVRYCGTECQLKVWKDSEVSSGHKRVCSRVYG